MRIVLVHNRYRTSAPSGEDAAVRNEQRMLEKRGVEVVAFDRCNDDIDQSSLFAKAAAAANTIWSQSSREALSRVIRRVRPDIVHVHNTFSMLSPSIYGACGAAGVPVVQTLHNYRLFCPGALFLRNGMPCEACVDSGLLQSVRHRCYRDSYAASATLAAMLALHRRLGTYSHGINRFIALTEFGREKAIRGGLAPGKVAVKPNFIPDPPHVGAGEGEYVLYVGRLLEGKGVETLLAAWRELPSVRLLIVGDGALRPAFEAIARRDGLNIEFAGVQDRNAVLSAMAKAAFLVMPSVWYETFGLAAAEAFACGTPVLASRIGSLDELVEEGITGRKFVAGDPQDLARLVRAMLADQAALHQMRVSARAYFEAHLTEERNFSLLMKIYEEAMAAHEQRSRSVDSESRVY